MQGSPSPKIFAPTCRLQSVCLPDIPTAAWLCVIDRASPDPLLLHGASVLVWPEAFVEGGWAGRFEDRDFISASFLTGSAGQIGGGSARFRTSSHTLEPLYSIQKPGGVLISNSLLFLMAATELSLRPDYFYYDREIMTVMFGLDSYTRELELEPGAEVALHYCADIKVRRDLSLELKRILPTPSFQGFTEYKSYLLETLGSVLSNLRHDQRPLRYEPLSTVSTGYDSPAAAALGAVNGCREAMTFGLARDFLTSRSDTASRNDSGVEIANALGMRASEFDADAYRAMTTLPEAEFLATGYGGEDVIFAGAEPVLDGRVLLTGYHGDRIWSWRYLKPIDDAALAFPWAVQRTLPRYGKSLTSAHTGLGPFPELARAATLMR
jgi:hypothetical protein